MTFTEWKSSFGGTLKETAIDEIEAQRMYPDDGRVPHVPFGFANDKWLKLKAKFQPGDVFYFFSSPEKDWRHLAGREGYMLVRGEEFVDELITMMN